MKDKVYSRLLGILIDNQPPQGGRTHAEERRLANFVDFIGEGRGSRTLAQALLESEQKVEALKEELESLRRCRGKAFQVPPLEWIEERLTKLKDILERNSERSGLLLRKLLGPLRLEPTCAGDNDRPFYKATTLLNTLALVDPLIEGQGEEEVLVSSLTSIGELPTRRACQTNLAWGADDAAWARQAVDARRDFPSRYAGENETNKGTPEQS